jgi:hypothetical protein
MKQCIISKSTINQEQEILTMTNLRIFFITPPFRNSAYVWIQLLRIFHSYDGMVCTIADEEERSLDQCLRIQDFLKWRFGNFYPYKVHRVLL